MDRHDRDRHVGRKLSDDGQRAFVGIDSENGLRVVSFATPDGSLLWSTVLPGALKFPGGGGRLAIAPNGDVVAAWGSTDFRAAALSPIDGSLAWDTALPGAGQFALVTGLSVDSSGTVYFTGGSGTDAFEPFDIVTTALDGATGGELWTTSTGQPLRNEYGLDLGLSPDEGSLYVLAFGTTPSLQPAALYALDPADGSELWASDVPFHVGGFDVGPKGTRVYVAGGTQPGLDVAAFDAITGASLWTQEIDGPLQESAQGVTIDDEDLTLYVSGVVESFFDDSVAALFAFDPEDGAKLWSATIGGEGKHRGKLAVADTQASRVYLLGEAPSNGSVDGLALAADVPSLVTAAGELSLAAGGDTDFRLRGGPDRAFDIYWVFGSLSGTTPGIDLGTVTLPLNQDAWFDFTLAHPFAPALDGFFGQLDADGLGEATLKIPAGAAPALAGLTMHHAYLATPFASFPGADFASNAIALELQP